MLSKTEYYYTTHQDLVYATQKAEYNYTYHSNEGTNWQDELASVYNKPITYDESGNITSYNGYTYTWENGRQLSKVTNGTNTYTYTYDDNGIRTSKTVNGLTTNYVTDNGLIISETNDNYSINYWYDENNSPIGFTYMDNTVANPTTEMYLYTKNMQGDITGILDKNGSVQVQYWYNAWGDLVDITGPLFYTLGLTNRLTYRGYYWDYETGYYYLQSRYYSSTFSRFINADKCSFLQTVSSSLECNSFVYCLNGPIFDKDPSGNISQEYFNKFINRKNNKALKKYVNSKLNIYILHSSDFRDSKKKNGVKTNATMKKDIKKIYKNAKIDIIEVSIKNFSTKWKKLKSPDIIFINSHGFDDSRLVLSKYYPLEYETIDNLKYHKTTELLFLLSCYSMKPIRLRTETSSGIKFSKKISGLTIGHRDKLLVDEPEIVYNFNSDWIIRRKFGIVSRGINEQLFSTELLLSTTLYSAYIHKWIKF